MLNIPDIVEKQKVPLHQKKAISPSEQRLMRPGTETADENQLQESIDNLDMLLANLNNKQ